MKNTSMRQAQALRNESGYGLDVRTWTSARLPVWRPALLQAAVEVVGLSALGLAVLSMRANRIFLAFWRAALRLPALRISLGRIRLALFHFNPRNFDLRCRDSRPGPLLYLRAARNSCTRTCPQNISELAFMWAINSSTWQNAKAV